MKHFARNSAATQSGQNLPLYAPLKTIAGVGVGLPVVPSHPLVIPPLPLYSASPLFPTTVSALNDISHEHIHRLSISYNEDFGVVNGDNEAAIKRKFTEWIQGR